MIHFILSSSFAFSLIVNAWVLGFCNAVPLHAQTAMYTWTDEKGIVHYSDTMVPTKHLNHVETIPLPSRQALLPTQAEPTAIPLVILNDDPSQKFVNAVLEGDYRTREVLMLVDTGAQITVLDEALAEELSVEHIEDAVLVGVTGAAQGWIGRLPALRLGAEEVKDLRVMIGPVTGRILLGMDVLEHLQLSVGPQSMQRIK